MAFRPNNTITTTSIIVGNPVTGGTVPSVLTVAAPGVLSQTSPTIPNTFLEWDGANFVWVDASVIFGIGSPVAGGVSYSQLFVDLAGNLDQVTPSADGFLFWNNTTHTYSFQPSGSGNMAIGNVVGAGTAPAILFIGPGNVLAQDPTNFSWQPTLFFNASITDGATYNSSLNLTPTSAGILLNDIGTGRADILSLNNTHGGATLSSSIGLVQSSFNANPTAAIILSTDGTTISDGTFDANQYIIRWTDNNLTPTTARHYGNSFGANEVWSDGTRQSLMNASSTMAHAEFDDGVGSISYGVWNATKFDINYSNPDGYISQNYGDANQTYQIYTTPYQIYTDEAVTYNPGDTLTDQSTGATGDVVSDDGNGLVLLVNVVGLFQQGDIVDDGLGNQATLTHDGGTYSALHGVGQNVVPSGRYAMFLNTVTTAGVNDRYEIAHPTRINLDTPSLTNTSSSLNATFNFNNNINSTVSHSFANLNGGTNAALQFLLYNGGSQFMLGIVGSGNNTYGGVFTPNTVRFDSTQGDIAYVVGNSSKVHLFNVGGFSTANTKFGVSVDGVFVGNGKSSATPVNGSIYGTEGLGTDIGGGSLLINGGQGTGTGQGGYIYLQTARQAGSTGSSLNSLNTIAVVNENQFITTAGRSINVTPHGDSAYLAKITDELVAMSIVTSRVVTLPSAAAVGVGATLTIKDANGGATGGQTITITPDGTDSIDDDPTGYVINTSYGSITIVSDGNSNWIVTSKIV